MEKETHLQFSRGDEQATIETEIGCHMRRLREHPLFTLTDYRTIEIDSELHIVHVNGVLPIGCISVTSSPRKDSSLSSVVSDNVLKDSRQCNVDFDYSWSFDPETYNEEERTRELKRNRISAIDEVDYLGCYLDNGHTFPNLEDRNLVITDMTRAVAEEVNYEFGP